MSKEAYNEVITMLSPRLRGVLERASCALKQSATEIRFRSDLPMTVLSGNKLFFMSDTGETPRIGKSCETVSADELEQTLTRLCEYSVYARESEIMNGYITVKGGHRVGLCGSYIKNKRVERISSLNIRIASACVGCSERITVRLPLLQPLSLLVAGPPGSGKTTILRDLVRMVSSAPRLLRTAVIDERGEIAAVYRGKRGMDVGVTSDVLDGYPRDKGFEIAVRSLSPQIAVCDEIGSESDAAAIELAALSGVKVFATAHAEGLSDLMQNKNICRLIKNGRFQYICLLCATSAPGELAELIKADELQC